MTTEHFSDEQLEALNAPLDRARVATRRVSNFSLSYIEGWWAVHEANRIFGFGAWTNELRDLRVIDQPHQGQPNYEGRTGAGYFAAFIATVRVSVGNQFHDGVGYGEGIDYNNAGQAVESATKEAETDAMKRALKNWGNPFGLALYDKTQAEVTGTAAPSTASTSDRIQPDEGECPVHPGQFYRPFKNGGAGHKDENDKWCIKRTEAAASEPEAPTPPPVSRSMSDEGIDDMADARAALDELYGEDAHELRRLFILNALKPAVVNHPNDITAEQWASIKSDAMDELASRVSDDDAGDVQPDGEVLPF